MGPLRLVVSCPTSPSPPFLPSLPLHSSFRHAHPRPRPTLCGPPVTRRLPKDADLFVLSSFLVALSMSSLQRPPSLMFGFASLVLPVSLAHHLSLSSNHALGCVATVKPASAALNSVQDKAEAKVNEYIPGGREWTVSSSRSSGLVLGEACNLLGHMSLRAQPSCRQIRVGQVEAGRECRRRAVGRAWGELRKGPPGRATPSTRLTLAGGAADSDDSRSVRSKAPKRERVQLFRLRAMSPEASPASASDRRAREHVRLDLVPVVPRSFLHTSIRVTGPTN